MPLLRAAETPPGAATPFAEARTMVAGSTTTRTGRCTTVTAGRSLVAGTLPAWLAGAPDRAPATESVVGAEAAAA